MSVVVRWLPAIALGLAACSGGPGASSTQVGASGAMPVQPLPAAPLEDVGTIVATVGDGRVGSNDFAAAAAHQLPADGHELTLEERKQILDQLVDEEALWQEAARLGLYRDPKVRKMMVTLLLKEQVYGQVRNSDFQEEELRAYFDAHRAEFALPEKVEIRRIFVGFSGRTKEEALALATDAYTKVKAKPDSFKDVAAEVSEDAFKRRGGEIGYVALGEQKAAVDPAIITRAFAMKTGELSEPFEASDGYNVLRVENRRAAVDRTYDQMKGSVMRKLKAERSEQMTAAYVDRIRGAYPVKVDEQALLQAPVKPQYHGAIEAVDEEPPPTAGPDGDETEAHKGEE